MSGSRWKYPKAKRFVLENPISNILQKMQSMPNMRSFFNQTSVILQADSAQSELLNNYCIGHAILAGPSESFSCRQRSCIEEEMFLYELTFEEGFFLSYEVKCLQVFSKTQEGEMLLNDENLWQLMRLHKHGFAHYYKAYSHLRSKNWIVRTGLQYGVHYMAYSHHPSHVHAEYSVLVVPEWEEQMQLSSWSHMQGIIRLCGNVAKTLLLVHVARTDGDDRYPRCLESYTIKETEVKRWLPQKHRMDKSAESVTSQNQDNEEHVDC